MTPGERIRLLEEGRDLLLSQPSDRAILILAEFGIGVSNRDDYESDDEFYLGSLQYRASDDNLLGVIEYLRAEASVPTHDTTSQPWSGPQPLRAFLSHIHDHRGLVGDTKRMLEAYYGIEAFVAHDDIDPSKRWREVIKAGLDSCDIFVAFLHDGYHTSQWCDQEAGWVLARGIPVLVIHPAGTDRTKLRDGFLEEHQDVTIPDGHSRPDGFCAQATFIAALAHYKTRDGAEKALVEAIVNSFGQVQTTFLWEQVEKVRVLEPAQLRRLEYAVNTNRHVYEATVDDMPIVDRLKDLVARFEPTSSDEPPF